MKIARFNHCRLGVVEDEFLRDVTAALDVLPPQNWPFPSGDALIAGLPAVRDRIATLTDTTERLNLSDVVFDSPVANPGKIIGAPVNYRAHQDEIGNEIRHDHVIKPISEWGLFLKANSSLCGVSDKILRRFPDERTDHEVELGVVIGCGGSDISQDQAMKHVAGYSIALDITLRGPQFQSFRKSIDSYAVLGPWLVTSDELSDPTNLPITLHVNGTERQSSTTANLIYDIPRLIEFASSFYTLHSGDIIMTGTPEGVGPLFGGDQIEASIGGIGAFRIDVEDVVN